MIESHSVWLSNPSATYLDFPPRSCSDAVILISTSPSDSTIIFTSLKSGFS